jgi:hypothetical protein
MITMLEKYYNIHEIVKFKIISEKRVTWSIKNILKVYENFETDKLDKTDFEVYLGNFIPCNNDCIILEDKYYIKKDYFFCNKDIYKFTKWQFELNGIDQEKTIVKIHSNFFGYMWMAGFIVEFLIHFKMNLKGHPIIHASAVSKKNYGIIFSARGGGGKTTLAMKLLNNGFNLLGDNFVIIKNGRILSYLTPLNIFKYNLTPIINSHLTIRQKLILNLKNILYKVSLNYIKIFTTLNTKKLFPNKLRDEIKLNNVFVIIPSNEYSVDRISKLELVDYLLYNQKLDTLLFLPYIFEYSYIFPDSKLAKHWENYKKNLINNLSDEIKIHKVNIVKHDSKELKQILSSLE